MVNIVATISTLFRLQTLYLNGRRATSPDAKLSRTITATNIMPLTATNVSPIEVITLPSIPLQTTKECLHPILRAGDGLKRKLNLDPQHPLGKVMAGLTSEVVTSGEVSGADTISLMGLEGNSFGTLFSPAVSQLKQQAKPSPFGRSQETVYDETVRKGIELTSDQFSITDEDILLKSIEEKIKEDLFPDAAGVTCKRYKMAIYEAGGHFDIHWDTVHAENHLATLLIEVNSPHKGGKFVLDYGGNKPYKISLASKRVKQIPTVKWIAFYTDVPHKVEPVTDGTRIVLQYDVLVTPNDAFLQYQDNQQSLVYDMKRPPPFLRSGNDGSNVEDTNLYNSDEEDKDIFNIPNPMKHPYYSSHRDEHFLSVLKSSIEDSPQKAIAIPMYHMYTASSIKVEYLKNTDRQLLRAILATGEYEVGMIPVHVEANTGWAISEYCEFDAKTSQGPIKHAYIGYEGIGKEGSFVAQPITADHPLNQLDDITLVVSTKEGAHRILHEPFLDYAGNEAVKGEYEYLQGVMIIRKR